MCVCPIKKKKLCIYARLNISVFIRTRAALLLHLRTDSIPSFFSVCCKRKTEMNIQLLMDMLLALLAYLLISGSHGQRSPGKFVTGLVLKSLYTHHTVELQHQLLLLIPILLLLLLLLLLPPLIILLLDMWEWANNAWMCIMVKDWRGWSSCVKTREIPNEALHF